MCLNFGTCGNGGVLDFEIPSPRISPIFGTLPCRVPTFGTALPILPAQVTLCHPQLASALAIVDDVQVSSPRQFRDLALDRGASLAAPGLEVGVGGDAMAADALQAVHLAEQQNRAIGEILVLRDFERDAQVGAGYGRRLCGIMVAHAAIRSSLAVWRKSRTTL